MLEKVLLKYCERLVVVVLFSYSNMMVRCVMVTVSMLTLVFLMLIQHDEGRSLTYTMSCFFFFFKRKYQTREGSVRFTVCFEDAVMKVSSNIFNGFEEFPLYQCHIYICSCQSPDLCHRVLCL